MYMRSYTTVEYGNELVKKVKKMQKIKEEHRIRMRRKVVGNHIHRSRNPLVNPRYLVIGPYFMVMNQKKSDFNLLI